MTTGSGRAGDARGAAGGVDVADFGIRGMDLAYALATTTSSCSSTRRRAGSAPGTLYVIEADLDGLPLDVDAHAMDPVKVLALAKTLGGELPRTLVLGCEPRAAAEEFTGLSEPVRAALRRGRAAKLLDEVLRKETAMKNAIIVIGGLVAAGGAIAATAMLPEIRRYMKIRSM